MMKNKLYDVYPDSLYRLSEIVSPFFRYCTIHKQINIYFFFVDHTLY